MFANLDFAKIELRLLSHLRLDKLYSAAAALPKKHPFRFALLYSAGPATAERMTRGCTSEAERRVHLEAEIQCFENWQRGEDGVANNEATFMQEPLTLEKCETMVKRFDEASPADSGTVTGRWFNRGKSNIELLDKSLTEQYIPPEFQFPSSRARLTSLFGMRYGTALAKYADVHAAAAVVASIDWCRCGGNGFWYEQIDGPDNMRKVKCERHEEVVAEVTTE